MPFTSNGANLYNAQDVYITNVAQDEILKYNGGTAKWNNINPVGFAALANKGGLESSSATSGSNIAVDLNSGNVHHRTLTGAGATATFTISNVPAVTSTAVSFTLYVVQGATLKTVNWNSSVTVKWAGGTAPTLTQTSGATDVFVFEKIDGISGWFGSLVGSNFS
ncbi:hypothetical protein IPL68_03435 [Candidatus Saccharibacteria bacterium]|nr:MAG: hypothetical protein IPL68_03435 [Candidatus Saccharibacteria bacterium]